MATMYEKMMERLVDRVERQAVDLANAKQEVENLKKELAWMKEQRDQAEAERRKLLREVSILRVQREQRVLVEVAS